MKWYSIDRLEESGAVLIDDAGKVRNVAFEKFSRPPREGDRVRRLRSGIYVADESETEHKRNQNNALLKELLTQGNGQKKEIPPRGEKE